MPQTRVDLPPGVPAPGAFLHPFAKLAPAEPQDSAPLRVHVHDVEPANELHLCRVDMEKLFKKLATSRSDDTANYVLEACSHDYLAPADLEVCPFVEASSENALIAAAHQAYAEHLPLAIHPDVLWLCILQGLAHHVVTYVPTGKDKPVTGQEEKIELWVEDNDMVLGPAGRGRNNWGCAIDGWCSQIQRHIGQRLPSVCEALRVRFSTSTHVSATAFNISFMAVLKNYFDFKARIVCGIPYVEIHGTKQDYEHMMEAMDVLDEIAKIDDTRSWKERGSEGPHFKGIDLMAWKRELKAVLSHFVAAFDQDPKMDRDFWVRIYKFHQSNMCGDPGNVTGWISKFLPYLARGQVNKVAEGMIPPEPASFSDFSVLGTTPKEQPIKYDAFGPIMSDVPFKTFYHYQELPMALASGLVGVRQNQNTGVMSPEIGWLVANREGLPGGKTRTQLRKEESDRFCERMEKMIQATREDNERKRMSQGKNTREFEEKCGCRRRRPCKVGLPCCTEGKV